ncbi:hypothetical protein DPMN_146041 [Dreissena polymorpha]|uniref:Tyrosine specific protein phosphatases domain-containing protein n=1 Tax=Dreissena polymorpha TaxID=45954 RepID=A0A9D4IZD3_DREPO|nr:hypothetical protein DPMN_146041 [Dreissena polymorpha]
MLNFLIDAQDSAGDGKVLVQCSDGFTRSGFFAVIGYTHERIKRDGELAVPDTVRVTKYRCHRVIPNEKQYLFSFSVMSLQMNM